MLVFAAVFLGTWRPLPMAMLELGALVLLAVSLMPGAAAWEPTAGVAASPLSLPLRIFLLVVLCVPLVQLIPLPLALWSALPGREFYAKGIELAADGGDVGWRAISLIPSTSEAAWLVLLPPLAIFIAATRLPRERLLGLVIWFLVIAAAEALLGLGQYGNVRMQEGATGSYNNRNHLAGLLEMALPMGLALLAATVGQARHRGGRRRRTRTLRQWIARFSIERINQAAAFGVVSLAIFLGLIFTRSRAGVALAMVGIVLCILLFSFRLGGRNASGLVGSFTAVGVGLASLIGLYPVWTRFAFKDPGEDARWTIFNATIEAIGEFFPLGSGAGTFLDVMRRFHPMTLPGVTINRAHNDYLEWLLEFGLLAGVMIAVWLLFYLRQWGRVWKRGDWTPFRFAQAGAGIGLLLLMLHSSVDYNLRVPANAVFAALLAAVFFHRAAREPGRHHRSRESAERSEARVSPEFVIPPENRINPFDA